VTSNLEADPQFQDGQALTSEDIEQGRSAIVALSGPPSVEKDTSLARGDPTRSVLESVLSDADPAAAGGVVMIPERQPTLVRAPTCFFRSRRLRPDPA
jgi:hypothetical protein